MKTLISAQISSSPAAGRFQPSPREALTPSFFRRLSSQSAEVIWVGALILIGCLSGWVTGRASPPAISPPVAAAAAMPAANGQS